MAGLFQGDQLPDVTKTTETQQTAPEFYTNYLQDIANLGQNAVEQGGIAGFSPLQQQAFQMAPRHCIFWRWVFGCRFSIDGRGWLYNGS